MLIFVLLSLTSGTLLSVIEVGRHGARVPLLKYPWNTYDWEVNLAELTHLGMMQHYLIGRELRFRYITSQQILPPTYNLTQIYIRSTDTSRTVMSAQAHMFGLYPTGPILNESNQHTAVPPFEIGNLNETLKKTGFYALPFGYQPVDIDVNGLSEDFVLAPWTKSCPRMKEIMRIVENSQKFQDRVEKYNSLLKSRLEEKLGVEKIEFDDVGWIGDSFECIDFEGFADPYQVLGEVYDEILEVRDYLNAYVFEDPEARNLFSSGVFLEVVNTFKGIIDGKSERKFSLYMTHDIALVAYLMTLKKFNGKNPPFASSLIFELHQEDGKSFVKVFYNDEQLELDFCGSRCEFEHFVEFVDSWRVKNVKEACSPKGKQLFSTQIADKRDNLT